MVLGDAEGLSIGSVATFYMTGEGLSLPAGGEYTKDNTEVEAPVARAVYVTDIK